MGSASNVRSPRQSRSRETKERILSAAFALFREKGYFRTTTNEIAQSAGVSIGSLYSYYRDKDAVLIDILDRYHRLFEQAYEKAEESIDGYREDLREWIFLLMQRLTGVHLELKQLNLEIKALSFSNPALGARVRAEQKKAQQNMLRYFEQCSDLIRTEDRETAALVVYHIISALVDLAAFETPEADREKILRSGADAVYRYLIT